MREPRHLTRVGVAFLALSGGVATTLQSAEPAFPLEVTATILSGREIVTTVSVRGATARLNNGPLATAAVGIATVTPSRDGTIVRGILAASAGSPIVEAHLHLGPIGANGPVLFNLFEGYPPADGLPEGLLDWAVREADLVLNRRLDIKNFRDAVNGIRSGNTYIDIHTEAFPDGEVRGQIAAATDGGPAAIICGDFEDFDCGCNESGPVEVGGCGMLKWICDCTGGTYEGGTRSGTCTWPD